MLHGKNCTEILVWNTLNQQYSVKEQKEFEKSLFNKTHKGSGDVILLDNWTIVYRNNVDLLFYVMGSTNENEVK